MNPQIVQFGFGRYLADLGIRVSLDLADNVLCKLIHNIFHSRCPGPWAAACVLKAP